MSSKLFQPEIDAWFSWEQNMWLPEAEFVPSVDGFVLIHAQPLARSSFLPEHGHISEMSSPGGVVYLALAPSIATPQGIKCTCNLPVFLEKFNHVQMCA